MKNSIQRPLIAKFAIGTFILAFALNFNLSADASLEGAKCSDTCEQDDYKTCNIPAVDAEGHPITVICHFMKTKKP